MKRLAALTLLLSGVLSAGEVSSPDFGFSVEFPGGEGFTALEKVADSPKTVSWRSACPAQGLAFVVLATQEPLPNARPTFKENTEEWERRNLSEEGMTIVESSFVQVDGHDARHVVLRIRRASEEMFVSNWMIDGKDTVYFVIIAGPRKEDLTSDRARRFLGSIHFPRQKPGSKP